MYSNLPDLESLRCFVAAAQTHNFRKAAKLVHLSPGAFSERILRLEEQLGVALFVRTTRRVALSEEGSRLLAHARQLEEAQGFHYHASTQQTELSLTLGTRYELGLSYLLPILEEQQRTHPHWQIHLFFADAPSLTSALLSSEVDVVFSSMRVDNPKLNIETTHPEHYVLVAKPQLAAQITMLSDLRPHTLVDIFLQLFHCFAILASPISCDPRSSSPASLPGHHIRAATLGAAAGRSAVLPLHLVQAALSTNQLSVVLPQLELQHDHFRLFWTKNHWAVTAITELAEY